MRWLLASFTIIGILQYFSVGTKVLLENREPGKTMAWLFILGFLPILGYIIYLIFGKKTQGDIFKYKHLPFEHTVEKAHQQQKDPKLSSLMSSHRFEFKLYQLLLNNSLAPMSLHSCIQVLNNGGDKFRELFNALEGATHHIHLSYYIFNNDEIGEDVFKILARKVSEGVEVRVLLDGIGSIKIRDSLMKKMCNAGIQAKWFFPIRFPYFTNKLNLRYHRKIVVVDGSIGFMGGLNIGNEYLSRDEKLGFWRDTHLKLEGEVVHALQSVFLNDWFFVTRQKLQDARCFPKINVEHILPVQIMANGPDSNWTILQGFFTAVTMAKQSIYIETPYFIPEESLMMALKTAALSGIDVRLVVQGVPEHKVTFYAMHSYFDELLQTGVKIYQYMKGILHAKILIVDNHLASVGSANLDVRSFFLDFEISAFIYDYSVVEELKKSFIEDVNESRELMLNAYKSRPLLIKLKESYARLLSPLL